MSDEPSADAAGGEQEEVGHVKSPPTPKHEQKREEDEVEEGELPPSELDLLKEERLRKKLNTLLNGSLPKRAVYCTIVYNRLSKYAQRQIEEIIQDEFDDIQKEREEDTKQEREEQELEDAEIVTPRALVQYYPDFFVDKMGDVQYLQKTNIVSVAPKYTAYEGTLGEVKPPEPEPDASQKTPKKKGACWNCGSADHQLMDCPQPRNRAAIEENRQEHLNNSSSLTPSNTSRYYEEEDSVDQSLIKNFKPGVLSQTLKSALGMGPEDEPPFYRSMRIHGYPPAYIASELEMEDPFAKKANEPNAKNVFPGLNIPVQRSPALPRREVTTPQSSTTPNGNTTTNPTPPSTSTPNLHTPTISPVMPQTFSPFSPLGFGLYTAANAAANVTQRYAPQYPPPSPYKPPPVSKTTTETDLTETDMDMT